MRDTAIRFETNDRITSLNITTKRSETIIFGNIIFRIFISDIIFMIDFHIYANLSVCSNLMFSLIFLYFILLVQSIVSTVDSSSYRLTFSLIYTYKLYSI